MKVVDPSSTIELGNVGAYESLLSGSNSKCAVPVLYINTIEWALKSGISISVSISSGLLSSTHAHHFLT